MKSRGIIIAWVIGESIIIYRGAFKQKRPPWPGELFWSSLVFISLGFLAEIESFATPAVLLGFGWDIAAFMNLFDPAKNPIPPFTKQVVPPDKGAI